MFTSEPSLAQRIERMIGDVPIVDTRSYLDVRSLGATDLAGLIAAPPILRVLHGVGMPAELIEPTLPVAQRVVQILPYLHQIRNTSAAWCLFRILRDLYDFDEPHLTLDNYQGLLDRVALAASRPDWGREVIQQRARVQILVAPVPGPDDGPANPTPDFIRHRLDIVGADTTGVPFEQVRSGIYEQLDESLEGPVRFAGFGALPDLTNPVHTAVLEWHHLHGWPLQVVLDPAPGGDTIEAIERVVRRYPLARFGLLTSDVNLGIAVASLAGQLPNLFAEGFTGKGAWPSTIEPLVRARVEQAGITKSGGFASGATTAEWVYGTLQAVRKATAGGLSQAVIGGFFEEDELPPLLRAFFAGSPQAWYRLAD